MSVNSFEELNGMQLDALKEVVSIGAGNAATALAGLLGERTNILIPEASVCEINDGPELLGGAEKIVSCVMVEMSGDINGIVLYFQELDFINVVLDKMLGQTVKDYSEINELQESALVEVGNIIIGSCITALAGFTALNIRLSVPAHCINMAGGILMVPVAEINAMGNKIMLLDGSLLCGGKCTSSKLLLLPSMESLNLLLQRLGVVSE